MAFGAGRLSRWRCRSGAGRRRGGRWCRAHCPVVLLAPPGIRKNAIRLGQFGGAVRRHVLKFLAEVLNLVWMVARDQRTERFLDLLSAGCWREIEVLVMIFLRHGDQRTRALLLLKFGDVGGRQLTRRVGRQFMATQLSMQAGTGGAGGAAGAYLALQAALVLLALPLSPWASAVFLNMHLRS